MVEARSQTAEEKRYFRVPIAIEDAEVLEERLRDLPYFYEAAHAGGLIKLSPEDLVTVSIHRRLAEAIDREQQDGTCSVDLTCEELDILGSYFLNKITMRSRFRPDAGIGLIFKEELPRWEKEDQRLTGAFCELNQQFVLAGGKGTNYFEAFLNFVR
ncbi:hypothetical protein HYW40_02190 [Candidatus Curtissbacteria bacterium]|nr:hypothetical protein [Candidatus Curtissbacteria bacterium]